MRGGLGVLGAALATLLGLLLVVPLLALFAATSPTELLAAVGHPRFAAAIGLSVRTTLATVVITMVLGTPLAWWLASSRSGLTRVAGFLLDLPIVVPPAVVGVALLQTFGRRGLLGPVLDDLGVSIPFTSAAVVLAQLVVASPLYVQAAATAFRRVDPDTLLVARTLGASSAGAFLRVALPVALPGLIAGASLAWARALGEFGATLLFAGNLAGRTQTMPLAIFTALESDLHLAVVFSLVLVLVGGGLLLALRLVPDLAGRVP